MKKESFPGWDLCRGPQDKKSHAACPESGGESCNSGVKNMDGKRDVAIEMRTAIVEDSKHSQTKSE